MSSNADTVATHYNSIKEVGLSVRSESKIYYLRNFNNWIKSILINEIINKSSEFFNEISVLDLGSGKGGDQLKWAKHKVSHVTFLDIADESIRQSKERFKKKIFRYKADFFVSDFTKVSLKTLLSRRYNIISCQFAFHYSFESFEQANLTFKNISENLLQNGYFIGTTVNGFELMKKFKNSKNNEFGNDVYKVTFSPEFSVDNIALFGSEYNFFLEGSVDCPEFVVYPPLMDHLALQNNLKLIFRNSLPEFYKRNIDKHSNRNLITKIKALQEFRIKDLGNISTEEFPIDKEYLDSSKYIKLLTISQSEWEVIQLYDVFVYQKF